MRRSPHELYFIPKRYNVVVCEESWNASATSGVFNR